MLSHALIGPETAVDVAVLRVARQAMATAFEVMLPFGTPSAQPAAEAALDLIDELEDQLSVFRDHSEVSRMNATAAERFIVVESELFNVIVQSAQFTRQTEGAFDIATGALTKAWGFYARQGRVPSTQERADAMSRTGTKFIAIDFESRSVKFLRRGLEINLGSIGKGYALDRAAELLRQTGISSALVHGGSSSVRAIGAPPGQGRGWPVRLAHPWQSGRSLGTVYLSGNGLGTSAATFQHFEYNGRKLGHVLDPRTGWPAEGVEQVSVIARSASEADALSTAFYVMGLEATARYCKTRPEIGVVILPHHAERPTSFNLLPEQYSFDSASASEQ